MWRSSNKSRCGLQRSGNPDVRLVWFFPWFCLFWLVGFFVLFSDCVLYSEWFLIQTALLQRRGLVKPTNEGERLVPSDHTKVQVNHQSTRPSKQIRLTQTVCYIEAGYWNQQIRRKESTWNKQCWYTNAVWRYPQKKANTVKNGSFLEDVVNKGRGNQQRLQELTKLRNGANHKD